MIHFNANDRPLIGHWQQKPTISINKSAANTAGLRRLMASMPIVAVLYNAIFAALAAHGMPMNVTTVVVCEVTIIFAVLAAATITGFGRSDILPLAYIYISALLSVTISLAQTKISVDGLRNVLIITGFTILGSRATEKMVRLTFTVCTAVVLVVLIWEITSVTSYAAIFRPADYLAKTRGYDVKEFYEDVGLSIGTIGYSNRFSFGIFTGPRTSSIFLEQVGINCFAITLMVYLSSLWIRLSTWEKVLSCGTIVLIVLSNNARMASLVLPVLMVGYYVYPKLPRYSNITIPVFLMIAMVILFRFEDPRIGDDLIGRVGVTYRFMTRLQTYDLLTGNSRMLSRAYDTGYGYIIASTSIFGAIAYWIYLTFIVPQDSVVKRRTAWSMNTYIYLWLMVGGTASFSMKTASLLWFLVGFVRVLPADSAPRSKVMSAAALCKAPPVQLPSNAMSR